MRSGAAPTSDKFVVWSSVPTLRHITKRRGVSGIQTYRMLRTQGKKISNPKRKCKRDSMR